MLKILIRGKNKLLATNIKKNSKKEPCRDGIVLYIDCHGSYKIYI